MFKLQTVDPISQIAVCPICKTATSYRTSDNEIDMINFNVANWNRNIDELEAAFKYQVNSTAAVYNYLEVIAILFYSTHFLLPNI